MKHRLWLLFLLFISQLILSGCLVERKLDDAILRNIGNDYFSEIYTISLENNQTINDYIYAINMVTLNYTPSSSSYLIYGFANVSNGSKPGIVVVPVQGLYPTTFHLLPENIGDIAQHFSYASALNYIEGFVSNIELTQIKGRPFNVTASQTGWSEDYWLWGFEVKTDSITYCVYFNGTTFEHFIINYQGIIV